MNFNHRLASAAIGLALITAALPGAAFAKTSVQSGAADPTKEGPFAQTFAKDSTKVQGFSTDGEMSDEDCQGFADQIQDAIDTAIDDADSNDIGGMLANLDVADSLDGLANEMGCAITYPTKTAAPTKSAARVPAAGSGASFKVEGWSTGDGPLTEGDCETLANSISQELDWAGQDLESGDLDQMFYDLGRAELMEDQALDGGCALSYPK